MKLFFFLLNNINKKLLQKKIPRWVYGWCVKGWFNRYKRSWILWERDFIRISNKIYFFSNHIVDIKFYDVFTTVRLIIIKYLWSNQFLIGDMSTMDHQQIKSSHTSKLKPCGNVKKKPYRNVRRKKAHGIFL